MLVWRDSNVLGTFEQFLCNLRSKSSCGFLIYVFSPLQLHFKVLISSETLAAIGGCELDSTHNQFGHLRIRGGYMFQGRWWWDPTLCNFWLLLCKVHGFKLSSHNSLKSKWHLKWLTLYQTHFFTWAWWEVVVHHQNYCTMSHMFSSETLSVPLLYNEIMTCLIIFIFYFLNVCRYTTKLWEWIVYFLVEDV